MDNRIENLELMTLAEHGRLHHKGKKRGPTTKHGTQQMYRYWKCRCNLCKEAESLRKKRYRLKQQFKRQRGMK
jgi:hypothetical protein